MASSRCHWPVASACPPFRHRSAPVGGATGTPGRPSRPRHGDRGDGLVGIGNSLVDVNAFTVLQRIVPDAVMGRVFGAVESLLIGGMAVGALLMPLLMATVGLWAGLAILGSAVTALVVVGLPRLRQIDTSTLAPAQLPLVVGCEILAPLSEAVQEELARSLVEVHIPPGGLAIVEGEPGDHFYLIDTGTAEVLVGGVGVAELGPGDGFGELALLRGVPGRPPAGGRGADPVPPRAGSSSRRAGDVRRRHGGRCGVAFPGRVSARTERAPFGGDDVEREPGSRSRPRRCSTSNSGPVPRARPRRTPRARRPCGRSLRWRSRRRPAGHGRRGSACRCGSRGRRSRTPVRTTRSGSPTEACPGLRRGTRPAPRAMAAGAPRMKPRASMAATLSTRPRNGATSAVTTRSNVAASASRMVMSLKATPGVGEVRHHVRGAGAGRLRRPGRAGRRVPTG